MVRLTPLVLALAAIGCSGFATYEEHQELSDRVDKVSAQAAQKNDMQALLYEEIVKQNKALVERTGKSEALVAALEISVRALEDQVKTLRAQVEGLSKGGASTPAAPADAPKPQVKLEDILREIEVTVAELRNGRLPAPDAAARLKIHAPQAAPKLLGEIRDHFANLDYTRQLEGVLAQFPPAELRTPLQTALQQRSTREAVVRIVGAAGDRELSRLLEPLAQDADEDFLLALGEALVKCRNSAGIPLLVASLKSEQPATRLIAVSALKRVNRGEDLGFRAQAPAGQNAAAQKAWEEWAEKFGKAVFE
jgi:cell division septum initiation protein DivIVA